MHVSEGARAANVRWGRGQAMSAPTELLSCQNAAERTSLGPPEASRGVGNSQWQEAFAVYLLAASPHRFTSSASRRAAREAQGCWMRSRFVHPCLVQHAGQGRSCSPGELHSQNW